MPKDIKPFADWELMNTGAFLKHKLGLVGDDPDPSLLESMQEMETVAMLSSDLFFLRNYVYIADKRGDLVLMEPWNAQLMMLAALRSQRKLGLRQQIVEIKPRQIGLTTLNLGICLGRAMHPNMRVTVMVIEKPVADELSHKLATMYNNLPPHMRPMKRIDNLSFVVFDNPNSADRAFNPGLNSTISISMPSAERGRTPHMVVASEFAFWKMEQQTELTTGLISAMPLDDSACVIIDTTPNGHDDVYEPIVLEAVENNPKWVKRWEQLGGLTREQILAGALGEPDHPDRGFVPMFLPWFAHEQYTTKDETPKGELPKISAPNWKEMEQTLGKLEKYGGEEEAELAKKFMCSIPRLYWRRRKIDSYKQPDLRTRLLTFRQEYATTWQSCFVDYEETPFDASSMDIVMLMGKQPAAKGIFRQDGPKINFDTTWHSNFMEWRLYAPPDGTEKYIMAVDTAYAYESTDSDAYAVQIIRASDLKQVAVMEARMPEYKVMEQIYLAWQFYNHPYYAIETANNGYGMIREAIDRGMDNTYYWKRLDRDQPEESKFPGWQTDVRTRPLMENALMELICHRDSDGTPRPLIQIVDIPTLRQLASVKRGPSGSIKNERGHDDLVDALMIACAIRKDSFFPYQQRGKTVERRELNALAQKLLLNTYGRGNRNNPTLDDL